MIVPILHSLKSPTNVGSIVRSHRAFGGTHIAFAGHDKPWRFKKGTQAFSRRLEDQLEIAYLTDDNAIFDWCANNECACVALEISEKATPIDDFVFPERIALVCGNEATGLSEGFQNRCAATVVIPQSGPVGSLNVATACSIALYSYSRQFCGRGTISSSKFIGENVG